MSEPTIPGEQIGLRGLAEARKDNNVWAWHYLDALNDVEHLKAEVDRQAAEIEAFRQAVVDGTGPSCEDVCQQACIGVCGDLVVTDDD